MALTTAKAEAAVSSTEVALIRHRDRNFSGRDKVGAARVRVSGGLEVESVELDYEELGLEEAQAERVAEAVREAADAAVKKAQRAADRLLESELGSGG